MRKLFLAYIFLMVLVTGTGIYIGKSISLHDAQRTEERLRELLVATEYKDFPEVAALKKQKELPKQNTPTDKNEIRWTMLKELTALEKEYSLKLSKLVREAKLEYGTVKAERKPGATDAFIKKYLGLLKGLEEECDVRVFAVLLRGENALKHFGYDLSSVEQAREDYEQVKKKRRAELLN